MKMSLPLLSSLNKLKPWAVKGCPGPGPAGQEGPDSDRFCLGLSPLILETGGGFGAIPEAGIDPEPSKFGGGGGNPALPC